MLPIPYEEHIPALLKRSLSSDSGGTAYVNKVDALLTEWRKEVILLAYLKSPEKCPSTFLDELGYYLSASITSFDTERQKRSKIQTAIERHKRRGSWTRDAKGIVDAICGNDSQLVKDYFGAQWILWASESTDPADYTTTMGNDGIDDNLGIDLIGTWTECVIEGIICIDCDTPVELSTSKVQFLNAACTVSQRTSGKLSQDRFVLGYLDVANDVYLAVYDSAGNLVTSPYTVGTNNPTEISLCTLDDDSIVYVWGDSADGNKLKFEVYDVAGTLQDSGTIDANGTGTKVASHIDGQTWACVYYDVVSTNLEFVVYTDGTLVSSGTIDATNTTALYVTRFSDDKFITAYRDQADANKGKFIVIDTSGSVYIAETQFEGNAVDEVAIAVLDEANEIFCIAYNDSTTSEGRYVFHKGTAIYVTSTVFESTTVSYIEIVACTNENVAIAYEEAGAGSLIVLDKNGVSLNNKITFYSGANLSGISASMLTDKTFVLVYSETGIPEGSFITYTQGLGVIDIENLVKSLSTDIAPAYMKVHLCYYDSVTGFLEIYTNGTMG